jgi:hypothetical protein
LSTHLFSGNESGKEFSWHCFVLVAVERRMSDNNIIGTLNFLAIAMFESAEGAL